MALELYGTRGCPYTAELRAELEWNGKPFVEYDVEADEDARTRLLGFVERPVSVPVLVDEGRVVQIGWKGKSCYVGAGRR
jgi:mycoredoxin